MLYQLIIADTELSYAGHSEDFGIGVFETQQQAEAVAQHYLRSVPGFCTHPCVYRILPRKVKSRETAPTVVWWVQGWNTNTRFDEVDIVESDFLPSQAQAEAERASLQNEYSRQEWSISEWKVGYAEWAEGFQRE